MTQTIDPQILEKASRWLVEPYDAETRKQVQYLIDNDPQELTECFYRNLEFGTGGLRGIMGVGTNRMNTYTVAMATQGLANYIKKCSLMLRHHLWLWPTTAATTAMFLHVSQPK